MILCNLGLMQLAEDLNRIKGWLSSKQEGILQQTCHQTLSATLTPPGSPADSVGLELQLLPESLVGQATQEPPQSGTPIPFPLFLFIYTSPGDGNGNPLQYSYLRNSMDRVWQATVHEVA